MANRGFSFGFDEAVGKDWTSYMELSPERLEEIKQRLNFIFDYEIDPSWRGFCEFSHKDIGGPFEQLGVIRKRVRGFELLPYQMHVYRPMMYQVDDLSPGWWDEVFPDVRKAVQERAIRAVNDQCEKMIVGFNIPKAEVFRD